MQSPSAPGKIGTNLQRLYRHGPLCWQREEPTMDHCSDLTRTPGAPNQVRIPYLDALRCLAILLVIALHVTAPIMVSPTLAQTNTWLACMVLDPLVRVAVPLL